MKGKFVLLSRSLSSVETAVFVGVLPFSAVAQVGVQDIFGRSLNQHGITLVDWDGYMANPLIEVYLFAPTNAALPGSVMLSADGPRLYFDVPSTVSSNGPSKSVSLTNANVGAPVQLSTFPDRDSASEDYTLNVVFTDAHSVTQTNTVPIHVLDLDLQRTNALVVTANFERDATGVFTNALRRLLASRAANDWTYFFSGMNLDPVQAGTEQTFIWSNNFDGGYYFLNTNTYTGYLLYPYGTTNATHRSGGEGNSAGGDQTSGGVPLPIHRSGGFESEIYGNYNTLGWLFLTNDNDWLVSGNLGNETNDFYSIAHHEIGHAIIFNPAHPGFNTAKTNGAFTSAAVTNYYGGPVPIDSDDHLTGAIDPESGQGAFGYEYYGSIPRKRWIMTKLDLLCAQEVGYVLRSNAAFTPLTFSSNALPAAAQGALYAYSLSVTGGIPFYAWDITAGTLPPGLTLDPFSGTLSGTPTTDGLCHFTVRVRDYHEGTAGVSQDLTLNVATQPRVQLALTIIGQGSNSVAQLFAYGVPGQQEVIEVSRNLLFWAPLATNTTGTNPFEVTETNAVRYPSRFYRAVIQP
jgi:hypothetical protein